MRTDILKELHDGNQGVVKCRARTNQSVEAGKSVSGKVCDVLTA